MPHAVEFFKAMEKIFRPDSGQNEVDPKATRFGQLNGNGMKMRLTAPARSVASIFGNLAMKTDTSQGAGESSSEIIWAFDLGKGSIGEAVRQGTTFLHKASLLIPADFAETRTAAKRRRMWRTRQAHKAREQAHSSAQAISKLPKMLEFFIFMKIDFENAHAK
ncbi:MAG TPA: hypothetical protein VFM25_12100 [Verrucomicrobiae bacterium]|nr:hypothetical protein [Verrucomicrobiae bacterium]